MAILQTARPLYTLNLKKEQMPAIEKTLGLVLRLDSFLYRFYPELTVTLSKSILLCVVELDDLKVSLHLKKATSLVIMTV